MSDAATLTIHLTIAAAPGAPRVPLKIAASVTSAALRAQAVAATRIPAGALKLIFRGRLIAPDEHVKAVEEYKLEDGSVLHCMGKPEEGHGNGRNDNSHSNRSNNSNTPTAASTPSSATLPLPSVNLMPPASVASMPTTAIGSNSSNPLQTALRVLQASNPPAIYKTAVETLEKLVAKIIQNPMEAKYRTVKKDNPALARKLGSLPGGDQALKAAGFVLETNDDNLAVYRLHASAEAWPQLVANHATLQTAVQHATAAAATAAAAPVLPSAAMPAVPAEGMAQAAAQLMSNPQALQNMMQNPMVQDMIRNDPRFANNPMARQMMENLASNPAMLQQVAQMMQDPTVQQQMQQMSMEGGNGADGFGAMLRNSGSVANNGRAGTGNGTADTPRSDQDMTEEDMIAEAIRRSLQDGDNSNSGGGSSSS